MTELPTLHGRAGIATELVLVAGAGSASRPRPPEFDQLEWLDVGL